MTTLKADGRNQYIYTFDSLHAPDFSHILNVEDTTKNANNAQIK